MIYSDLRRQASSSGDALAFLFSQGPYDNPEVVTGEVVSVELEESPDDGARVLEYTEDKSRRLNSDGEPEPSCLISGGLDEVIAQGGAPDEPAPPHRLLVFQETEEQGAVGRLALGVPHRVYPDGTPPVDHWETYITGAILRLAAGPLISTREVLFTTEEEGVII